MLATLKKVGRAVVGYECPYCDLWHFKWEQLVHHLSTVHGGSIAHELAKEMKRRHG